MLTAAERPRGGGSRQPGRGRLIVGLGSLLLRVQRFAEHRACSDHDRRWAARLFDQLEGAYRGALDDRGAGLGVAAVEQRRAISRKVPTTADADAGAPCQ